MNSKGIISVVGGMAAMVLLITVSTPAFGQNTGPDMSVCNDVDECGPLPNGVCDSSGFTITLTNYTPAPPADSGSATYTYTICAPANNGTCSNTGATCQDHSDCWTNRCQNGGPHAGTCSQDDSTPCSTDKVCNSATCSGDCRVDKFQDLSHTDVAFPALDGTTCLSDTTTVTVSCNSPARGNFAGVTGDGSCFTATSPVAKCNDPQLSAGQCLTMTLTISGELNKPGQGAAVLVDKEGTTCTASCIAGPSCVDCPNPPPPEGACLTRTIGFWGTHPGIAGLYDPVTVCGAVVNGQAAGACSTSEALCSNANDRKSNPPYLQLIAQLTAAKLNLNATAALLDSQCSDWSYNGHDIIYWLGQCDTAQTCSGTKSAISTSGCIEALTAFNESQDTGFDVTPPPFDSPGPASPAQCQAARGNGKAIRYGVCS